MCSLKRACFDDGMTFFPPDPEMPEPEETEFSQPRWWEAPEDELPVLLPVAELLAATDHVAIALHGIAVHRDGVLFRVERRLRRKGLPAAEWQELCEVFMEHMRYGGPFDLAGRLRFGVVLADGEKVVADENRLFGADPMAESEGHSLSRRERGGGGGGSAYASADHLWLWPLPPAGPLELVLQWPALGIDETRVVIDGSSIRELAESARPYWSH